MPRHARPFLYVSALVQVADGINAYGVGSHRHAPEIEQGLGEASGADVVVNFTPHLMPMSRGILEVILLFVWEGAELFKEGWMEGGGAGVGLFR